MKHGVLTRSLKIFEELKDFPASCNFFGILWILLKMSSKQAIARHKWMFCPSKISLFLLLGHWQPWDWLPIPADIGKLQLSTLQNTKSIEYEHSSQRTLFSVKKAFIT
jgi:hypothetical protein